MIRDDHLEKLTAELYSTQLPYHNFHHIRDVLSAADEILSECKKNEINPNELIIYHAILFHDAEYHENHKSKGFDCKESYSASLAENILREDGYSEEHILNVKQAIMATHMHGQCKSKEDYVVRAADLYGLMATYTDFREKTLDLYNESKILNGANMSWNDYKKEAYSVVKNFLEQKIDLDIKLYQGESDTFREAAYRNLTLLKEETD